MRTIFHGFLSAVGRGLDLLLRPLARRLDARVEALVQSRLAAELEAQLVPTLSAALSATSQSLSRLDALMEQTSRSTRETDQTLGLLLDEVNRLREQIESLQSPFAMHETDGEDASRTELAIVDHDDSCDEFEAPGLNEHAKVG